MTANYQNNPNKQAIARKWGIWGAVYYCVMFFLSILIGILGITLAINSASAAPLLIIIVLYLFAWIGSIVVNMIAAIKYKELNNPLSILFGFFALSIIGLIIFLVFHMSASNPQQNVQNYHPDNQNRPESQNYPSENQNRHDRNDYESQSPHRKDETPESKNK